MRISDTQPVYPLHNQPFLFSVLAVWLANVMVPGIIDTLPALPLVLLFLQKRIRLHSSDLFQTRSLCISKNQHVQEITSLLQPCVRSSESKIQTLIERLENVLWLRNRLYATALSLISVTHSLSFLAVCTCMPTYIFDYSNVF